MVFRYHFFRQVANFFNDGRKFCVQTCIYKRAKLRWHFSNACFTARMGIFVYYCTLIRQIRKIGKVLAFLLVYNQLVVFKKNSFISCGCWKSSQLPKSLPTHCFLIYSAKFSRPLFFHRYSKIFSFILKVLSSKNVFSINNCHLKSPKIEKCLVLF